MTKKRIALIWVATLLVAISVLFPIDISQPQPDTYTFRIGNTAMAHDADYTCDGVNDHVEFQQLLDALPAAVGGRIEVEAGYYVWGTGETVTRNISNVTIIGVGGLVSFDGDDTTAIFTAGDDSWTFENIVTDAGGIDTGSTSGYLIRNVLVDTTFYAFVTDNIDIEDHGARHESGGSDAIKLDDLATPDDNTDLNSTTGYHGLLPKLAGNTTLYLRSDGTWAAIAGGAGDMLKSTYDTDDDGLIDTAAGGTEWDSSAVTGVVYINAGAWTNRATGIADTNIVVVDGTVISSDHCRFTADGLEGLSSAELLAALSGEAGASFDWNGQDLTNVGTVDGRDVSADGTKLDGIEAGADVTDAANVAAAGAVMESDYNATTFLYATLDDTPQPKTPAEVLAILSGEAGASFDWNGQDLTNVGDVDGRDISADGTKLDGIEAGADVTDAANVAAAGALMDADTDNVDDTHINWGSGAGQVDADDVAESGTRFWAGESGADVTDAANVDSAGAVMESDYDATTFLYATSDDTPQPKTPAEVLAILSGDAGATFDWNEQTLIDWGIDYGTTFDASAITGQLFLHTLGGNRNIVYQYDGSNWNSIVAFGTTTFYVDPTGDDDYTDHGHATGTDAFATIQYAVDTIPSIYGGTVTVNIAVGTYSEDVTIRGKNPTGNYNIYLSGTMTETKAGTIGAGSVQGSAGTQGTLVDDSGGMTVDAYQDLIIYEGTTNAEYRVIDSNTATTHTIVGTWTTGAPVNTNSYAVYDWGTHVDSIGCSNMGAIVLEKLDITGTGTWRSLSNARYGTLSLDKCKLGTRPYLTGGSMSFSVCIVSNSGTVTLDVAYDSLVTFERSKLCAAHTSATCALYNNANVVFRYGSIVDGTAGAAKAAAGWEVYNNAALKFENNSAKGYVRIRDCDVGIDAYAGGMVVGTANNQYSGNTIDEQATGGSFGYID